MKIKIIISLFLTIFILTGCATPLTVQNDGKKLARVLDIEDSEIQFISYCSFDEIRAWEEYTKLTDGIVALTNSELLLLGGDLEDTSHQRKIRLSIVNMDAVGLRKLGLARQVQVKSGEHLIVLNITSNKSFQDREGSQKLVESIAAFGIPIFETEEFYIDEPPIIVPIVY